LQLQGPFKSGNGIVAILHRLSISGSSTELPPESGLEKFLEIRDSGTPGTDYTLFAFFIAAEF
jgi:hypothetical protein